MGGVAQVITRGHLEYGNEDALELLLCSRRSQEASRDA